MLSGLHGWAGLLASYGTVQGPLWVGLYRANSPWRHYLLSPLVAAPLGLLAGAVAAAAAAGSAPLGLGLSTATRWAVGLLLGAGVGFGAARSMARSEEASKRYERGALVEAPVPPPRRPSAAREGVLTLAGVELAPLDETKHFKLIGTTGTGKSSAIQEILSGALARGDRAVIADPDAGYLARYYQPKRGDVILNPFDSRSKRWDLFGEIRESYDVEQVARSLIPDQEGPERSWRAYARTFFTAVTRQAHEAGVREVGELYRLLVAADTEELRILVNGTPAQPFLDEHNSRMFDSIRSVTSSAAASLEYIAQQRAENFSVRRWIDSDSGGVLFMPYRANQIAALHATISAWMRLAIFETMNQEKPRGKTWFVVDELDALGHIDGLKDALARLRKFEGRCVLGFQSIAQVSSTYGQGDAHTIVENCGNTLILRCSASEGGGTSRFASQLIGEREVIRTSRSATRRATELFGSRTISESSIREPAVMAAEVEQLPDLQGYLKRASDGAWRRVRLEAVAAWQDRAIPAAGASHSSEALEHE